MSATLRRPLAVMIAGCALAAAVLSGPVQGRDRDHNRDDNRGFPRYQHNWNRHHNHGRHSGYAFGQYKPNYRGNGYYNRRYSAEPFAYVRAADQRRNRYTWRHHRRRRY